MISPFFVHEEQITSVGSTGDNSAVLARFSYTVRVFSVLSAFFTRFPRFGTFAIRALRCAMHLIAQRGPRQLRIICPPLV